MVHDDAESIARWVYDRTNFSQESPPGPGRILAKLIPESSLTWGDAPLRVERRFTGEIRVRMQRGLSNRDLCIVTARAVAAVAALLMSKKLDDDLLVRAGIAIVLPHRAVRSFVDRHGLDVVGLAESFVVPEPVARERLRRLGIHLASGEYPSGTWRHVG